MTFVSGYGAGVPKYSSSGLVTDYSGVNYSSGSQAPRYGSTGLIEDYTSSGRTAPKSTVNPLDPTGKTEFDPVTGKNRLGRTRGEQAAFDYGQNTALVTQPKNPAVAAATAAALEQQNNLAKTAVKSFSDYLDEARQMQQAGKETLTENQKAYSTLPAKLESGLSDTVKNFTTQTGAINEDYKALNEQQKATNQQDIAALQAENQRYEDAARAVGERAFQYAQARNNAYQSSSGAPTSAGGYWDQLSAKTLSDTMLPVEQDISRNRIQQLTNYITPLQQQEYAQNLSRVMNLELPVANTLASMGMTNAKDVAQFAASLQGRSFQEQLQYLSSLGLPLQEAQRLMMTLPQALAQISAIDQSNNFYTLTQDYQNTTPYLPTYSSPVPNPGRASQPNYYNPGYRNQPGSVAPVVTPPVMSAPSQPRLPGYSNSAGLGDLAHEVTPYGPPPYQPNYGPQYQSGFAQPDTTYGGVDVYAPQQVDDYRLGYGQYA